MQIVLTYSGSTWPKYLLANLQYLKSTFPEHEVILLMDNIDFPSEYKEFAECIVIDKVSPQMQEISSNLNHDPDFWSGFWYRTISRFFLLHSHMQRHPNRSVLHIEADVLLLPDFPFCKFDTLNLGLAYPAINESHGVASVFYVRDSNSLKLFLDFCTERAKDSPTATDMTMLADYAKFSKDVQILPSLLPCSENTTDVNSLHHRSFHKTSNIFGGIFDGATIGQYLFGLDPRNNLGIRTVFSEISGHFLRPKSLTFNLSFDSGSWKLNLSDSLGHSLPIYCLHIHSKDKRAFFKESSHVPTFLMRRVTQSRKGKVRSELVPSVIFFNFVPICRAIAHKTISKIKIVKSMFSL